MSKHDHDDCEHELAYCEQHDVAYCSKCDEEWAKWEPCTLGHAPIFYPNTTPWINPIPWYTTTTDTLTADTPDYTVTAVSHAAC